MSKDIAPKLLKPRELLVELRERGIVRTEASLATMRSRGGGPPFRRFGREVFYPFADFVKWYQENLSAAVTRTSELRRDERSSVEHMQSVAPGSGRRFAF